MQRFILPHVLVAVVVSLAACSPPRPIMEYRAELRGTGTGDPGRDMGACQEEVRAAAPLSMQPLALPPLALQPGRR